MSMIDWGAVWRSLDWDGHDRLSADDVLAQRTEKYARPPETDSTLTHDSLTVLVFLRGQERYGIPVNYVVHGVTEPHITPLPCVPDFYRGVINLRGQILTVLDLQRLWGLPATDEAARPRLVVVSFGGMTLALQADDVRDLVSIPLPDIVPAVTAGVGLEHVQGLSPEGIVLVDMESLAIDSRLRIRDQR
ncbi:MAG: purine-binding chemotaxis protein CheW [Anaerolineae bacterium]|nr:purine-binding chemotaxis protein CheW [Anaerolineae bacterium]